MSTSAPTAKGKDRPQARKGALLDRTRIGLRRGPVLRPMHRTVFKRGKKAQDPTGKKDSAGVGRTARMGGLGTGGVEKGPAGKNLEFGMQRAGSIRGRAFGIVAKKTSWHTRGGNGLGRTQGHQKKEEFVHTVVEQNGIRKKKGSGASAK